MVFPLQTNATELHARFLPDETHQCKWCHRSVEKSQCPPGLLLDGPSFMSGFQWCLYFRVKFPVIQVPSTSRRIPPEVCSLIGRLLGGPNDIFSVSGVCKTYGGKNQHVSQQSQYQNTPFHAGKRCDSPRCQVEDCFFKTFLLSTKSLQSFSIVRISVCSFVIWSFRIRATNSDGVEIWNPGIFVAWFESYESIWVAKWWAEEELKIEQLYHNLIFKNMRWVGSFCS